MFAADTVAAAPRICAARSTWPTVALTVVMAAVAAM